MTEFRLRTLGGAALERNALPLDTVGAQRKSLALLTLLAVSRSRGISRERVAAFLWPESDTERARGALKQTLHVVRRQLGSAEIIQGTSELRLNPSFIDSDVDAFLTALEAGSLERAVTLYGGPFLDGFHLPQTPEFEQWVATQRDALAQKYASTLERLTAEAETRSDASAAIEWLRRLWATEPSSGRITLRLMRALDASGDRVAAIRCAQAQEIALREDLGLPSDPEVTAMAERLREDQSRHAESRPAILPPRLLPAARDVVTPAPSPPLAEVPLAPRDVPRKGFSQRHVAVALVTLVAVVLVAVASTVRGNRGGEPAPDLSVDRSVAVLPFSRMSGDSANDHLSDGITKEVTTALSSVSGLRVASGVLTSALARQGIATRAIGDSLGVGTVLHGAVSRAGNRLSVTARLVTVADGRVLWSGRYDREVRDIFAIQADLVRAVADALRLTPSSETRAVLAVRPTSDVEAYELYLRARHSWMLPSPERLERAAVYYQAAIQRDPSFANAYAGLAETWANLSNFGLVDRREAFERARVAADRALELDPRLAEGHAAKAFVLASTQEFVDAEAAFQRAIELNPDYVWARHYYSLLLLMLGRTDEALEQNQLARLAEAHSLPANATYGIILLQRGDHSGAERELRRAFALSPRFPLTQYYLAVVLAAQGSFPEASALLDQVATVPSGSAGFTGVPGATAFVFQRMGRREAADSLLRDLESKSRAGDDRIRANLAFAYAAQGRLDAAFALFDRIPWDVPGLIELRADPLLEPMRADPRYRALLRRILAGPAP